MEGFDVAASALNFLVVIAAILGIGGGIYLIDQMLSNAKKDKREKKAAESRAKER